MLLPPPIQRFSDLIGALFQKTLESQHLEQSNHWLGQDLLPVPVTSDLLRKCILGNFYSARDLSFAAMRSEPWGLHHLIWCTEYAFFLNGRWLRATKRATSTYYIYPGSDLTRVY